MSEEPETKELVFAPTKEYLRFGEFCDACRKYRYTGGNFRVIHRLLMQIERILEINHLQTVTKEVVEKARERLVLG